MKMKEEIMMKKITLSMILIATTAFANTADDMAIKQEAKSAIMKMGKTLKKNMKKNMKAGGVTQAATFCANEASNIVKRVNASYEDGVSVRRISLKYRNPASKPTQDEEKVLRQIENDFKNGKKIPPMIVKEVADGRYKVYKPLFIKKGMCLMCHGDAQHRNSQAYKIIHAKYPHDKAIDYKLGDFRGAFVVSIIKGK